MRKLLSASETAPIEEVLQKTRIMSVVDNLIEIDSGDEMVYFMKLEALWILVNLSAVKNPNTFKRIFMSSFDEQILTDDEIENDFESNESPLMTNIDMMIRQIFNGGCRDVKTLVMIFNFIGNCFEDESPDFAVKVINETCFIESMDHFSQ